MAVRPHHGMVAVLVVGALAWVGFEVYKWAKTPLTCNGSKIPQCFGVSNPNSNCYACCK